MAISSKLDGFKMTVIPEFIEKAQQLDPVLKEWMVEPKACIRIAKENGDWKKIDESSLSDLDKLVCGRGDALCLDFGDHEVGYFSFTVIPVGSPPDAPAYLQLKFGETLCEIGEDSADYKGSLSSSWIQEERIHIDVLPARISLPRRYAFRYVEIRVLDVSPKYQIKIEKPLTKAVSAVTLEEAKPFCGPRDLSEIDRIGLKTLQDCMHSVFEDGPKRDRRLWLGDLRLQALVNYETFENFDLVKRCLYLFAGLRQNDGRIGACLFLKPDLLVDDTYLLDYALLFLPTLQDYLNASNDRKTALELWPSAFRQIELAMENLDQNHIVIDKGDAFWCFLDWKEGLNKQAGAQGVLLYTIRCGIQLAQALGQEADLATLKSWETEVLEGALQLWDAQKGYFVSGKDRQISWASQIWMILAGVFDQEKNRVLINKLLEERPEYGIVTPYLYHHLVEALLLVGEKEKALDYIHSYWGGMVRMGADCFWELYSPENTYPTPYGSRIINSYCHAWSCTSSYFIRKYYLPKAE